MDPEAYRQAVYKAYEEWKTYFKEHCVIVEYAIGAGHLDAASAVGGIAELNVNRLARWDSANNTWQLPVETGLNGKEQIAYTLNLAGNGVSYFTNDIDEVRWNPTLHITTEEELKAYNEAIANGRPYEGSSAQTQEPDNADLPVSLVVSGTLGENGVVSSAGTLVMTGHASYSGSTDVINGATLVVNGIIDGEVQSDASATERWAGKSEPITTMSSSPERTKATRKAFSRAFRQYGNSDAECASSVRRFSDTALRIAPGTSAISARQSGLTRQRTPSVWELLWASAANSNPNSFRSR